MSLEAPDRMCLIGSGKYTILIIFVFCASSFSFLVKILKDANFANEMRRYMPKGAEAVHSANPNVLVILSGLNYDTDLSFLQNRTVKLTFTGKLVFEVHRYGFTDGDTWKYRNANEACAKVQDTIMRVAGFLLEQGWPLFVSEFGMDLRGNDVLLNRYMNCFFALAAELDFDWNIWTLGGNYYIKQGVTEFEEYYGMLHWNTNQPRNSSFVQRLSGIQSPFQGNL